MINGQTAPIVMVGGFSVLPKRSCSSDRRRPGVAAPGRFLFALGDVGEDSLSDPKLLLGAFQRIIGGSRAIAFPVLADVT